MAIIRTSNVVSSFNRRSDALRQDAIKDGCEIVEECQRDGKRYFHARKQQVILQSANPGIYAEVGACFNIADKVWFTRAGGLGKIFETAIVQKK